MRFLLGVLSSKLQENSKRTDRQHTMKVIKLWAGDDFGRVSGLRAVTGWSAAGFRTAASGRLQPVTRLLPDLLCCLSGRLTPSLKSEILCGLVIYFVCVPAAAGSLPDAGERVSWGLGDRSLRVLVPAQRCWPSVLGVPGSRVPGLVASPAGCPAGTGCRASVGCVEADQGTALLRLELIGHANALPSAAELADLITGINNKPREGRGEGEAEANEGCGGLESAESTHGFQAALGSVLMPAPFQGLTKLFAV